MLFLTRYEARNRILRLWRKVTGHSVFADILSSDQMLDAWKNTFAHNCVSCGKNSKFLIYDAPVSLTVSFYMYYFYLGV